MTMYALTEFMQVLEPIRAGLRKSAVWEGMEK